MWISYRPREIHDNNPHLFVYSTPDTYGTGSFNNDNGLFKPNPAGSSAILGGQLPAASNTNGPQIEYLMGFYLTEGSWWFYFNGEWVGYYPLSWFGDGPLASNAKSAQFGGEATTGISLWPPMGSGTLAAGGLGNAVFQRNPSINLVDGTVQVPNLTPSPSAGQCYTVLVNNSSGTTTDTYVFFGGPGGFNC